MAMSALPLSLEGKGTVLGPASSSPKGKNGKVGSQDYC